MKTVKAKTIDEFISTYPKETQEILSRLRDAIRQVVPAETGEKISYGIPTFTLHGNLVHFSAYETHIGFYPGAAPIEAFKAKLKKYETSKGTVRFPINEPLPLPLIQEMVKFRVTQAQSKNKK